MVRGKGSGSGIGGVEGKSNSYGVEEEGKCTLKHLLLLSCM
jgi:hypothetical protein